MRRADTVRILGLSFLLPALVLLTAFAAMGMAPFGTSLRSLWTCRTNTWSSFADFDMATSGFPGQRRWGATISRVCLLLVEPAFDSDALLSL
jgi:hypothetical protein